MREFLRGHGHPVGRRVIGVIVAGVALFAIGVPAASATSPNATSAVAPPTPTLVMGYPYGMSPVVVGYDRHALVTVSNVEPGSGSVASVKIYYRPSAAPRWTWVDSFTVVAGTTSYQESAYGNGKLVNGRQYTFAAEVCNTDGLCTWSETHEFMPYGTPQPSKLTVRVNGLAYRVSWRPVALNAYPYHLTCKVASSDVATGAVQWQYVPDPASAGSVSGSGTPGTYTVRYTCSMNGWGLFASDPVVYTLSPDPASGL